MEAVAHILMNVGKFIGPSLITPVIFTGASTVGMYSALKYVGQDEKERVAARAMSMLPGCTPHITAAHDDVLVPVMELYTAVEVAPDRDAAHDAFTIFMHALDDYMHTMFRMYGIKPEQAFLVDPLLLDRHRTNVVHALTYYCHVAGMRMLEVTEAQVASLGDEACVGLPLDTTWRHFIMDLCAYLQEGVQNTESHVAYLLQVGAPGYGEHLLAEARVQVADDLTQALAYDNAVDSVDVVSLARKHVYGDA